MREFKLITDLGQEFSLMTGAGFLKDPAGLGFDIQVQSAEAGFSYVPVKETLLQKTVTGNMIFATYADYQTFARFIAAAKSLVLAYKPISTWYFLDVITTSLGKTEKSNLWRLSCPIVFTATGPWYEAVTIQQSQGSAVGKTYDYSYDFTYNDAKLGEIAISGVELKSPAVISILGPAVNPSWTLTQNGVEIMSGKVNATIPAGDKLVVNAVPGEMEIAEYTESGELVSDLYASSDFSTGRFVYVPQGDSVLYFTEEGGSDVTAFVEVRKLAATV